jgi:hypothetical protein
MESTIDEGKGRETEAETATADSHSIRQRWHELTGNPYSTCTTVRGVRRLKWAPFSSSTITMPSLMCCLDSEREREREREGERGREGGQGKKCTQYEW